MNQTIHRLLFLSFFGFFLCDTSLAGTGNSFLAVAQNHVDKISQKPQHKSPLEFKQAVARYIKHTDVHCLQSSSRHADENVSYKKELRYLFKNYSKISTVALLSRIRSAHQEMAKVEPDADSDSYKRYEQISSALLLTCAQVFFNDARSQIVNALDEIDNLIVYWRYQQHHQLSYFFSKSPTKWIMGKAQAKEIGNNIRRLERKQDELYTILGLLTGHVHAFTESGVAYDDCYTWIEELFDVLSCVQVSSHYTTDETKFDYIAAELGLKIKRVGSLKDDVLSSIASARMPNHFVRHWIAYVSVIGAAGYTIRYHSNNPNVLSDASVKMVAFAKGLGDSVVVGPLTDLRDVCFGRDSKSAVEGIEARVVKVEELANAIEANVAVLTKKNAESLRQYAEGILEKTLIKMKVDNKKDIMADVANHQLESLNALCEKTSFWNYDDRLDQEEVRILLVVDELLTLLQDYPELIDNKILPLIKEIGLLVTDGGKIAGDFVKNNFWTAKLAAFTPLAAACIGMGKTYQWAIKKNYSPIRIALADVNALLIESAAQLDDHDYGKLVYLICKLRYKASSLKDPLSHEFLADVAKLESKQYTPGIKRGIVENMFNKYAFLGRIAA